MTEGSWAHALGWGHCAARSRACFAGGLPSLVAPEGVTCLGLSDCLGGDFATGGPWENGFEMVVYGPGTRLLFVYSNKTSGPCATQAS